MCVFFFSRLENTLIWTEKAVSIPVKTFFFIFWRSPQFGQKNRLIFRAKFSAFSHFSGKSLVPPQIILSSYAHGSAHVTNSCKVFVLLSFKYTESFFGLALVNCSRTINSTTPSKDFSTLANFTHLVR